MVEYLKVVEQVLAESLHVDGSSQDECRDSREPDVASIHSPTELADGSPHHTDCDAEGFPCVTRVDDVDRCLP
eukprot:2848255-Amphidinium_carterae.1